MKGFRFFLFKLFKGITLLLGLSILTFIMIHNSPIDPVHAYVGGDTSLTLAQREAIEEYWGLDKPLKEQYMTWLRNILHEDLGVSRIQKRPVKDIILEKSKASFALMGISWTLSGIIGIILGIVAAINRGRTADKIIKWFAYIESSIPTFWLGLILLLIFAVQLKWFPIGISVPIGVARENVTVADKIRHMVLPVLTLSVLGIANVTLHTREKMIDVLNSEYVIFAKARGESTWEIIKNHGLKNAAIPAITIHFSYFGELFGGSVLAERVFSYPGLGSTLTEAGLKSDVPLLVGIVLFSAVFVFCGNMIADIINAIINPHLKEGVSR